MAGVFAPATDTNYAVYLNAKAGLSGPQGALFAERLVRYICWAMDNTVTLGTGASNEEWAELVVQALTEAHNTNGVDLNLSPASDTLS